MNLWFSASKFDKVAASSNEFDKFSTKMESTELNSMEKFNRYFSWNAFNEVENSTNPSITVLIIYLIPYTYSRTDPFTQPYKH
jgi:hypothetical protein